MKVSFFLITCVFALSCSHFSNRDSANIPITEDLMKKKDQGKGNLKIEHFLGVFDSLFYKNENYLFPYFSQGEYLYCHSKISVFSRDFDFLILIEVIKYHTAGKLFKEMYFFGTKNCKNESKYNPHKNIYYSNILDYDFMDKILDRDLNIDIKKLRKFNDEVGIMDVSFINSLGKNVYYEDFIRGFVQDEGQNLYASTQEVNQLFDFSFNLLASQDNWYYEDAIDPLDISGTLIIKPSRLQVFKEAARILSIGGNQDFIFNTSNSNYKNWYR